MSAASNESASASASASAIQFENQLFEGYTDELLNFASVTCILFIIIGVPSNLLTIVALLRGKQTRNSTAVFIVNLSMSDLLFGCFNLPLAASTFMRRAWIHSDMLCRLFPLLRYGLLAVSLFTVSLITINRYIIIAHPRQYPRIYQRKYLTLMVAATWLAAFSIMIPTWRGIWGEFGLDHNIGSCSILPDKYGRSPKEFLFVIAFLLPCLCIVICYTRIFYLVRRAAARTRDPTLSKSCSFLEQQQPQQQQQQNKNTTATATTTVTAAAAKAITAALTKKSSAERKQLQNSKCDNYNGISAAIHQQQQQNNNNNKHNNNKNNNNAANNGINDDDDDEAAAVYTDGMRPFFIDEDIEYIDVSDDDNDTPAHTTTATATATAANTPVLNNDRNHLNCVSPDTVKQTPVNAKTPSNGEGKGKAAEKGNRANAIAASLKTSFNRFNARKTHYVSMGGNTSNASSIYPGKMSQKDRRLLKMIFVIFVSFVICYLPITITKTFKSLKERHVLNISSYLLIYLTTCTNPLIYVLMSSEYRQAYWRLLKCQPAELKKNDYKRKGKP